MKKIEVFLLCFLTVLFLFGCNDKTTTTISTSSITSSNQAYDISDFYDQLVIYQTRIDSIVNTRELEPLGYPMNPSEELSTSSDGTITIQRDDILTSHYNSSFDMVYDDYFEQLITTQDFVANIKTMIEGHDDIELYEEFHPTDNPNDTFRFVISEEGYILIDASINFSHSYLKIGLDDDLLVYHELHYSYNSTSVSIKDSPELEFNYFKFVENSEAVYVNYLTDNASLRYTSIESDDQFTISSGHMTVEGMDENDDGYNLNMYDRELNCQIYLKIINDELASETYDIFDEYGLVYRYEDEDFSDESIDLNVNFVTATGWDYVVASDYTSESIDQLTGIFLADGTKIYDDLFNYTYTPTYGHLGMRIHLESKEDFTNELLSLNQFGLNLVHPLATVEHFNQIQLSDYSQIQSRFAIDNLNFFAIDLHSELYDYIDIDIRNDIEGVHEEPITTTGDVEEFNEAIAAFENKLSLNPNYVSTTRLTTELYDDDQKINQSQSVNYDVFDLMSMYYSSITMVNGMGQNVEYRYVLDGTKGPLVEFEIDHQMSQYEIISQNATYENFIEIYNSLMSSSGLSEVIHINQTNETTFELEVTSKFLNSAGIDTNILFEQQGITGLDDQKIIITYEFSTDYLSYDVDFTISNLAIEDYEIKIISTNHTVIEPVTILSPFDIASYTFYLPKTLDQILFTIYPSSTRVMMYDGVSYMQLYLEEGTYSIDFWDNYGTVTYKVYNDQMEELTYDERFTASTEGYYYVKFTSSEEQNVTLNIYYNKVPVFYAFTLNDFDSSLSIDVELDGISGSTITVPTATYDRILIAHPHNIVPSLENYDILFVSISFDDISYSNQFSPNISDETPADTAYVYLPKNRDLVFDLTGYFYGTFVFDYEYITVPTGAFDNIYNWNDLSVSPLIWMTEESQIARVNFTISEAGNYDLDTRYNDFGYSYQYAKLYKSDGTLISNDWRSFLNFQAGDYYIEYTPGYYEDLFVLLIPKIIKQS